MKILDNDECDLPIATVIDRLGDNIFCETAMSSDTAFYDSCVFTVLLQNGEANKWNMSADNLFQNVIDPTRWKNVMVIFDQSSSKHVLYLLRFSLGHHVSLTNSLTFII